jgi:hypothetical protein
VPNSSCRFRNNVTIYLLTTYQHKVNLANLCRTPKRIVKRCDDLPTARIGTTYLTAENPECYNASRECVQIADESAAYCRDFQPFQAAAISARRVSLRTLEKLLVASDSRLFTTANIPSRSRADWVSAALGRSTIGRSPDRFIPAGCPRARVLLPSREAPEGRRSKPD